MSNTPRPFAWPTGKRAAVSLSFDDARFSQIDAGVPLLDSYDLKGTFYVSPANLSGERLPRWRQAAVNGHEIGNHTVTHPCSANYRFSRDNALEDYDLDRIERELLDANDACQRMLGVKPITFAYPCGNQFVGRGEGTRSYVPLIAKHFLVGRGAYNEMLNDPTVVDLAQAQAQVIDTLTYEQVKRQFLDRALDENAWVIFCGHEVGTTGHQTTLATVLQQICQLCRSKDSPFWLDTVAAVGRYVKDARK